VDATGTRHLLHALIDAGWPMARLDRAIGLAPCTVRRICSGQPRVTVHTADAVAMFAETAEPAETAPPCPLCEDAEWLASQGVGFAEAAPRILPGCTTARAARAELRRHLRSHRQTDLARWAATSRRTA
jgi:hypothetical protein